MDNELVYKLALSFIPNVGDVLIRNLVSYCGGIAPIFTASKSRLTRVPGIGEKIAHAITTHRTAALQEAERELTFIEKHKIQVLFYTDECYPQRLQHCYDAPFILFYLGNASLNHPRIISIVGTRKATEYGKETCRKIVDALHPYNVLIVSGLAYGIDVAAHKRSLEQSMQTIGVLGHGLNTIYPSSHRNIARQMVSQGGLLTDLPSTTPFLPTNFPRRNRIIAGMADAVVVVETALKGGSIVTAEIANSYHKDVWAVPGNIDKPSSQGCNFLIKTNKALLLDEPTDLPDLLGWKQPAHKEAGNPTRQTAWFSDLTETEQKIYKLLQQHKMLRIDEIVLKSGTTNTEVASGLLALEFRGAIRSLPGKVYQIIGT